MHIHLVTGDQNWIMTYQAKQIQKYAPLDVKVTISVDANPAADVTISHWHHLTKKSNGVDISYFTHYEDRLFKDVLPRLKLADGIITMSLDGRRMTRLVVGNDVPIEVIPLGHDELTPKKIVIGVLGRTYSTGRKREKVIVDTFQLLKEYRLDYNIISFAFCGEGWSKVADVIAKMGYSTIDFQESTNLKNTQAFYDHIDYFLNTSLDEGGSLGVHNAFATGIPIISPPVGFIFDLGADYHFIDFWELENVLENLIFERYVRIKKVADRTWKAYSEKCIKFAEKVLNEVKNR